MTILQTSFLVTQHANVEQSIEKPSSGKWTFPSIKEIVVKTLTFLLDYSTLPKCIEKLIALEKLARKGLITKQQLPTISKEITALNLPESSLEHIQLLLKELQEGAYDSQDITEYLSWELRLTISFLQGKPFSLQEKVEKLSKVAFSAECQKKERESNGHSKSYMLQTSAKKDFAIQKKSEPLIFSSFGKHLPNLGLKATVWQHEMIGFEQDQMFGFNFVPTTMPAREFPGSIQRFVSNSDVVSSLYHVKGANLLKAIPKSHLHRLAISGFFKGISAGHMSNYLVKFDKDHKKITRFYEIDLEEMLLPLNQLEEGVSVTAVNEVDAKLREMTDPVEIAVLQKKKEVIRKSIILCRMCVLGLPQNAMPFDRAALLILKHPRLLPLHRLYQRGAEVRYPLVSGDAWKAQYERIVRMQLFADQGLMRKVVEATPRDLYFTLFGGRHLWELAVKKGFPDMITANNLVSDPYQHILKDYGAPENIPTCKRLEEPRSNSEEDRELMNFFRVMAGLNTK